MNGDANVNQLQNVYGRLQIQNRNSSGMSYLRIGMSCFMIGIASGLILGLPIGTSLGSLITDFWLCCQVWTKLTGSDGCLDSIENTKNFVLEFILGFLSAENQKVLVVHVLNGFKTILGANKLRFQRQSLKIVNFAAGLITLMSWKHLQLRCLNLKDELRMSFDVVILL